MTLDPQETPYKNFTVVQGATFILKFWFRNPVTNELLSLDGFVSALFFARPDNNADPIQIITGGPSTQNVTINYTDKTITIFIADEVTDAYSWGTSLYRFDLTDSAGNVSRRFRGSLTLEREIR